MTKKKNTEVMAAKPASKEESSVESFIMKAIETNTPVETMEKLFSLREKIKAEKAKEQFNISMSELQGELPVIKKLKKGHVAMFAPLEDIQEATKETIKKHGFSYRWNTSQSEDKITTTCIVTHVLGHSESGEMSSDVEEVVTGNSSGKSTKSAPQRAASTITFLKRYTFVNMFGITIAGEDFDGRMQSQNSGKDGEKPKQEATPLDVKSKVWINLKRLGVDITSADKFKIRSEIERLTGVMVNENTSDATFEDVNRELEIKLTEKYNEGK